MGNMNTGHDPVIVADNGFASTLGRATAESTQFADGVVVADDQLGVFTGIFFILGFFANRRKLKNTGVFTERRTPGEDDMWANPAAGPDCDFWSNDTEGANFYIICKLRRRVDKRRFVDSAHDFFPAHSSSQLATRRPSTRALHS